MDSLSDLWNLICQHIGLVISILFCVFALIKLLGRRPSHPGEDIPGDYGEGRIRISKRWAKGEDGETKTDASDGYVAMHPVLAAHLRAWQKETPHAKATDFVFPSMTAEGRKPLCASTFVADYLRSAAKKAGVQIADGQRFGLHNLRHSLSNWLVNKAKIEPKTVQGLLRHSKIQTTLDLYTQEDNTGRAG